MSKTFKKRYLRKKNLRGGKRKKRRTQKRVKRRKRRKTKRVKRRNKRRTKRKRKYQRGGNLLAPATFKCNTSSNIGEAMTGVKYNRNPTLPDPKPSNNIQKGGASWVQEFGFSDGQRLGYSAVDGLKNLHLRYKGAEPIQSNSPMVQNLKSPDYKLNTTNINKIYRDSANTASKY